MNITLGDVVRSYLKYHYYLPRDAEQRARGKEHEVVATDSEMEELKKIRDGLVQIFTMRVRRDYAWVTQLSVDITRIIVNDIDYKWGKKETDEGICVWRLDNPSISYCEEDMEYRATLIAFASELIREWKSKKGTDLLIPAFYEAVKDTIIEEVSLAGDDNSEVYLLTSRAEEIIRRVKDRVYRLLGVDRERGRISEAWVSHSSMFWRWQLPEENEEEF